MKNLPTAFHGLSIRNRVILLACSVSFAALLLAGGALYALQLRAFREAFEAEIQPLAKIVASNAGEALARSDKDRAQVALSPLSAKREIRNAGLQRVDGKVLAAVGPPDDCPPPLAGERESRVEDRGGIWMVVEPVIYGGRRVGTFYMDVNFGRARAHVQKVMIGVFSVVLGVAVLTVLGLVMRLERVVTQPLQRLSDVVTAVGRDHNYTLTVPIRGAAEVEQLEEAFNRMLAQLSEHERTLRFEQQKFRNIVEQLPAITYIAELGALCTWTYVSPQIEALTGHTPEEWLASNSLWIECVHPDDRNIALAAEEVAIATGNYMAEYRMVSKTGEVRWFRDQAVLGAVESTGNKELFGVLLDITEVKEAEARLAEANRRLISASRQAGMAEVTTDVLHNVGNVLNSVGISSSVLVERLRSSKIRFLAKAGAMLAEHEHDLARFISSDERGRQLPGLLQQLAKAISSEQSEVCAEVERLGRNVESIKDILAVHQSHEPAGGFAEPVKVSDLLEEALLLSSDGSENSTAEIVQDYGEVPPVRVDRYRAAQTLEAVIRNAREALEAGRPSQPRITLGAQVVGDRVVISISDNGIGIAPENLTRIFQHGFSTKEGGFGFGLHTGANAAAEMCGTLEASSEGIGCGATFTLSLPIAVSDAEPSFAMGAERHEAAHAA